REFYSLLVYDHTVVFDSKIRYQDDEICSDFLDFVEDYGHRWKVLFVKNIPMENLFVLRNFKCLENVEIVVFNINEPKLYELGIFSECPHLQPKKVVFYRDGVFTDYEDRDMYEPLKELINLEMHYLILSCPTERFEKLIFNDDFFSTVKTPKEKKMVMKVLKSFKNLDMNL
uniref:LRR containing protein n=1 Tax=Parastrongyloides trichosuri TaxID=131310 RepID=A0A0N5A4L4_PARTI